MFGMPTFLLLCLWFGICSCGVLVRPPLSNKMSLIAMNPANHQVGDLFAPVMGDSSEASESLSSPQYEPAAPSPVPPVATPPVVPTPTADPETQTTVPRAVGSLCRFLVDPTAFSKYACAAQGCSMFQGECLCRRTQHSCQNEPKVRDACVWEESEIEGTGLCKALIEKVYEKFDKLLSKRGKKDLSLNIQFNTATSSARFPFGPLFAGIYGAPNYYSGYQNGYGSHYGSYGSGYGKSIGYGADHGKYPSSYGNNMYLPGYGMSYGNMYDSAYTSGYGSYDSSSYGSSGYGYDSYDGGNIGYNLYGSNGGYGPYSGGSPGYGPYGGGNPGYASYGSNLGYESYDGGSHGHRPPYDGSNPIYGSYGGGYTYGYNQDSYEDIGYDRPGSYPNNSNYGSSGP